MQIIFFFCFEHSLRVPKSFILQLIIIVAQTFISYLIDYQSSDVQILSLEQICIAKKANLC